MVSGESRSSLEPGRLLQWIQPRLSVPGAASSLPALRCQRYSLFRQICITPSSRFVNDLSMTSTGISEYFLFHLLPLSMMRKEGVILTAFDRLSGDDSTFPEYLSTLRFLQRGFLSSGSPALDARIIREQPRRGQRQIEEDGQVDVNQSNAHSIL